MVTPEQKVKLTILYFVGSATYDSTVITTLKEAHDAICSWQESVGNFIQISGRINDADNNQVVHVIKRENVDAINYIHINNLD